MCMLRLPSGLESSPENLTSNLCRNQLYVTNHLSPLGYMTAALSVNRLTVWVYFRWGCFVDISVSSDFGEFWWGIYLFTYLFVLWCFPISWDLSSPLFVCLLICYRSWNLFLLSFFIHFFVLLPRNNFNCSVFPACCFHQCLLPLLCLFVYLTGSYCTILIGLNSPCSPGYFKLRIFLPQKLGLRTYSPMPRFPIQDQCQAGILLLKTFAAIIPFPVLFSWY